AATPSCHGPPCPVGTPAFWLAHGSIQRAQETITSAGWSLAMRALAFSLHSGQTLSEPYWRVTSAAVHPSLVMTTRRQWRNLLIQVRASNQCPACESPN